MPFHEPNSRERKQRTQVSLLRRRDGLAALAVAVAAVAGLVTRLALLGKSATDVAWNSSLVAAFGWGLLYDVAAALWWATPLALALLFLPARFLASRAGRILPHVFFVGLFYAAFFGAAAEWIFWDEFGVRFNFIAVDYLVYTKEVLGNIRESYPMPALYAGLLALAIAAWWLLARTGWLGQWSQTGAAPAPFRRWPAVAAWSGALVLFGLGLQQGQLPSFANNYNRELAKNGLWSLVAAFRDNALDYEQFYPTRPNAEAFTRVHELLARDGSRRLTSDPHDLLRLVRHEGTPQQLNVIQITVESLSADFLSTFNRASKLMPNMEAIAQQSLVFERFYATGTRTDRGMEALTLSIPPTPGRSLVKRPRNEHLFTLGSVFRTHGYETAFIYGGFGYFDNMNHFFGENGYRVVDRTKVAKDDITFANIWGACDEDLYRWTLREADRDHAAGKPFFYFVMTTSNHRPFTFPDGKIDLPSKTSGRAGGVKYSDYAIGELLRQAATKPWFKQTLFVFVGDHCAASAGKTELPVQNYHIPLLVYAPGGQIQPGVVKTIASQIDFAPTLLGLLRWTYPSRFYGEDVLALPAGSSGRALIGNYQKLGLLRDGALAVLKPIRQASTFGYNATTHEMKPIAADPALLDDAIAYYQTASWLFKTGGQGELSPDELAHLRNAAAAKPGLRPGWVAAPAFQPDKSVR
ncbi:LTA synthase family protein [Horticoccus sp. 23ND18S-11]|uniref:LTA synthase family protein n=1 Tax=Horticoccus sp. 23ND18S-11 TaxID=3391832 RepID=UPI0039C8D287